MQIEETVLTYRPEQLQAWKAGDRSIAPTFAEITPNYQNQPTFHFGEMFALRHFLESEGWKGFAQYALGPQYPGSERRLAGRLMAKKVIPAARLRRLLAARSDSALVNSGSGAPDLFLYKPDGSFKFAEVKKERDRINHSQLRCIAQILAMLRCEVSIVYLQAEGRRYTPKRYQFDLKDCIGEIITDSRFPASNGR